MRLLPNRKLYFSAGRQAAAVGVEINEENIPALKEKEKENPRILRPQGFARRPQRDQEPPEEGTKEIGCQLTQ